MGNKKSLIKQTKKPTDTQQSISKMQRQKTITEYKNDSCIFNEYKIYDYKINKTGIDEVRPAIHLRSRQKRAIKIIFKRRLSDDEHLKLLEEIVLLGKLNHPNVVQFIEYFEDSRFFYLVYELMEDGELIDLLYQNNSLDEKQSSKIFLNLIEGLMYLQQMGIEHKHINPSNVVFNKNELKIIDFKSATYDALDENFDTFFQYYPQFLAPEIQRGRCCEKSDIWSCGLIFYLLLGGRQRLVINNFQQNLSVEKKLFPINFQDQEFNYFNVWASDLLQKMIQPDSRKRINIKGLQEHPYFQQITFLSGTYQMNLKIIQTFQSIKKSKKIQQAIYQLMMTHILKANHVEDLSQTFKAIDTNNDGYLTKEEILQSVEKDKDSSIDANFIKKLDEMYQHQDKIDYQEFLIQTYDPRKLLNQETLIDCFNYFDKDSSGKISMKEFQHFFQKQGLDQDKEIWDSFMAEADENQDGEIEIEEFKNLLKSLFKLKNAQLIQQQIIMLQQCNKILFVQNMQKSIHAIEHLYNHAKDIKSIQSLYISNQDWKNDQHKKILEQNSDLHSCVLPFRARDELQYLLDQKVPLKWVHIVGTGIDNFKPLFKRLKELGIVMTNSKGRSGLLLAEFAVLGSLYFSKNMPYIISLQQNKKWENNQKFVQLLTRKKALIIGLGSIGGEIAKKCHYGFNMKIIGVKRDVNQLNDDLKPCVDILITIDQVQDMVGDTDYIYLSLPGVNLGEIVNKDLIKKMKKGVIIVNVGRGDVINEDDLAWGIKEGIIGGAALDVLKNEPLTPESQFYNDKELQKKVLITSHSMDYSNELTEFSIDIFCDVLKSVQNNDKKIKNLINYDLGYQIISCQYYK